MNMGDYRRGCLWQNGVVVCTLLYELIKYRKYILLISYIVSIEYLNSNIRQSCMSYGKVILHFNSEFVPCITMMDKGKRLRDMVLYMCMMTTVVHTC